MSTEDQIKNQKETNEVAPVVNTEYPSDKQIDEWHAKYPNCSIRGYPFPSLYTVYRSYTMAEEEQFLTDRVKEENKIGRPLDDKEIELMLTKRYVLWPQDFANRVDEKTLPPGLPSMIANLIMVVSGYADIRPEIL